MTWQTMTWHDTEMSVTHVASLTTARDTTVAPSTHVARDTRWPHGGLGAAVVAGGGHWVAPTPSSAPPTPQPASGAPDWHQLVRVPRDVLRMMSEAAWAAGCSEEEIWIEAAREWLRRRVRDDEPPPTAPASAWPGSPRATHTWAAIDALVAELRPSA